MKKRIGIVIVFLLSSIMIFGSYIPEKDAVTILKKATAENYPDSNEVIAMNNIANIDNKGRGSENVELYTKVLKKAAIASKSKIEYNYDSRYRKVTVSEIKLFKKDGKVINFDPEKILKVKVSNEGMSENIYSDKNLVLTGEISNLEVGDIIKVKLKTDILKAKIEGEYASEIFLEDTIKVLAEYREVNLPSGKNLYIHKINDNRINTHQRMVKKGKEDSYRWTIKDKPLMIAENFMDDISLSLGSIIYTTIKDWSEVSKWYYSVAKSHLVVDDAIKVKVKELTKNTKDRDEKISNIFYWVAKNIRYLGVDGETNRPGFEPHDVTYTFKTRGGVCRDKAALLSAMLVEAGIDSKMVLISSGSRLAEEAPVTWFNHAITMTFDLDGKPQYILDPTAETTKEYLPKYEEDNSYLIARKEGAQLMRTPIASPLENNSTGNITLEIDKDGKAKGEVSFKYSGVADNAMRQVAMSCSKNDFERILKYLIHLIHPNIEVTTLTYSDPKDTTKEFEVKAKVEIPNYIEKSNGYEFIGFRGADPGIHFMFLGFNNVFQLRERKYNFKLGSPVSLDINYKVIFPEKIEGISIPKPKLVDNIGFKNNFKSKVEGRSLTTNYHLETKKIHFKKEEYPILKEGALILNLNKNLYLIKEGEEDNEKK